MQNIANKPARTAFYDNLKFILIALVVVGHFLGQLIDYSDTLKVIWRWIYMFHMPAFLFVGGMFAKKLYTPEKGLRVNVIAFYLVMGVLFYTALWIESQLLAQKTIEYKIFNIGSIPWYFFVMAALGASTPIIAKIKGGAKTVIPFSVFLALIVPFNSNFDDFLCLGRIFAYAPYYFAGYFLDIKGYVSWVEGAKKKIWPIVLAIAFMILLFVALKYLPKTFTGTLSGQATGHNPYSPNGYPVEIDACIRLIAMIIASAMIVAISLVTPTKNCLISGLGARTLQVYIAHPFLYYPVKRLELFAPLGAYTPWSGIAVIIGAALLAMLLAWPKWPEDMFQRFRKRINIDKNM